MSYLTDVHFKCPHSLKIRIKKHVNNQSDPLYSETEFWLQAARKYLVEVKA